MNSFILKTTKSSFIVILCLWSIFLLTNLSANEKMSDKIFINGDFRLRYQWEHKDGNEIRNRGRIRFRINGKALVNDKFKIGFGIATGGNDPRSTNQTFGDFFSTKNIMLDYAYGEYREKYISFVGGKYKRKVAIWTPDSLLWDGDINPEGLSLIFKREYNPFKLFVSINGFVLNELKSTTKEPYMYTGQLGVLKDFSKTVSLRFAVNYYGFVNINKQSNIPNSKGTNTVITNSDLKYLKYDYKVSNISLELSLTNILFEKIKLFADYAQNIYLPIADTIEYNKAYLLGFKVGKAKLKKIGDYQLKYTYRYIGADAWLDILPNSDFYGGSTDVKGHSVSGSFLFIKHTTLGVTYFYATRINETNSLEKLIQVDLVTKF